MKELEEFWRGTFGDEYTTRNYSSALVASNLALFRRALAKSRPIESVLEFGANRGLNLLALRELVPEITCQAVEINEVAARLCAQAIGSENVVASTIFQSEDRLRVADLVLFKGVLIHLDPDDLPAALDIAARWARRYVLICEYYSPALTMVTYRGHERRLFKSDFAGQFLDRHRNFGLIDYGFAYRRDPVAPQDDLTWFLLERFAQG